MYLSTTSMTIHMLIHTGTCISIQTCWNYTKHSPPQYYLIKMVHCVFKTNLQQSHIFLCSTFLKCPLVLFQSLIWWCCCHRGFDCCWCCCCALCPITLCSSFLISQAVPDHLPTHKEVVILPLRSLRLAGWLPLQGHAQFCVWQIVRYQTQENPLVARSLA